MSSRSRAFAVVLVILAFAHRAVAAQSLSGTLELDPAKTLIEFRLPGTLHATHGKFKLAHGTISADLATGEASGSIVVDASSGDTGIGKRDKDMRESVLEAQKYPEIIFTPRHAVGKLGKDGQFQAKMDGVLTIHGARHEIVTQVQGRLVSNTLTAACHFSVPYVEWGMEDPSLFFLTVAKQVEIDIATAGEVAWAGTRPEGPTNETNGSAREPSWGPSNRTDSVRLSSRWLRADEINSQAISGRALLN